MTLPVPAERYHPKPFKYSSHYWIARILAGRQAPLRILDAGTASGYLGSLLRPLGHHLTGVETHSEWAARARPFYDEFMEADLETFDFPKGPYDVIIFADTLEHLRDPLTVLRRARLALATGGWFVISVPNVAHAAIRLSLFAGHFDYTDRGILDRTHLRFFTRRTLLELAREAECRVIGVQATTAPLQFVWSALERPIFGPLHELHYAAARAWKTMFAYQFVLIATPDGPPAP